MLLKVEELSKERRSGPAQSCKYLNKLYTQKQDLFRNKALREEIGDQKSAQLGVWTKGTGEWK